MPMHSPANLLWAGHAPALFFFTTPITGFSIAMGHGGDLYGGMSLTFPNIDPVLIQIGPLAVRWYSLAYIAGIFGGWWLIRHDLHKRPIPTLTPKLVEDLVVWAIGGILLGGRLGYALFYQPHHFLHAPEEIFYLWEGGMSFHGGLTGFALAFFIFSRRHGVPYLSLMDRMAWVAPIGIGLGRLANFINGELWGRTSDVPWAMVFPHADALARHPSQLYEATLEGGLLFLILTLLWKHRALHQRPGCMTGLFLIGYAFARSFCEQFREPDAQLGYLWHGATMGQLLCLPLLLLGVFLSLRAMRRL